MGSYYGKLIDDAHAQNRLRETLNPDKGVKVETWWDLGMGDSTAIWFAQRSGPEVRILDYYEASGEALSHYAGVLEQKAKERGWLYGDHVVPHDARQRSLDSGRTRLDTLKSLGISATVQAAQKVEDGIEAVRRLLPSCWFDEPRCRRGLDALRQYRAEYDDVRRTFRLKPVHDWACFVAGTMVKTPRGEIEIEALRAGDVVTTPAGDMPVTACHRYFSPLLVRISLSDGREVTCTPEHKFFTQRGLIIADALRYNDTLFSGEELSWRAISWISTAAGITGIHQAITDSFPRESSTARESGIVNCIGIFGRRLTALFLPDAKFITPTATSATMNWQISFALSDESISACTGQKAVGVLRHGTAQRKGKRFIRQLPKDYGKSDERNWCRALSSRFLPHERRRSSGTQAKTAANGIQSTPGKRGKAESALQGIARFAIRLLIRLSRLEANTAGRIAELKRLESAPQAVYDLTVDSHHCYIANGVMTSNSHAADAFRYGAMHKPTTRKWDKIEYDNKGIV
jgi:hypothetical protein